MVQPFGPSPSRKNSALPPGAVHTCMYEPTISYQTSLPDVHIPSLQQQVRNNELSRYLILLGHSSAVCVLKGLLFSLS